MLQALPIWTTRSEVHNMVISIPPMLTDASTCDYIHPTAFNAIPMCGNPRQLDMPVIEQIARSTFSRGAKMDLIMVEMPGVKKGDAEMNLEGRKLFIKGKRYMTSLKPKVMQEEGKMGDSNGIHEKRLYRVYRTTIQFQTEPNPGDISAELNEGVLSILLPTQYPPQRKIEVA